MAYKDTVLSDGPILYLTFDEAGSTIADSSTAARTVAAVNGPTKVTGISGTALQFDGTNDHVTATSVADHTAGSFTWEVWFKSTQTTGIGTFIRRDGGGAAFLLRLNEGKIEWYANNSGGKVYPATIKADGQWHHVVGVKNGTALTLYVDGVSVGTGTATSGATGTTVTYIGSGNATGEYLNGTLDEVAIYNKALTAARIQAHYNDRVPPTTSISVQSPAIAVNLTTPAPVATAVDITAPVTYSDVADRPGQGSATSATITVDGDFSGGEGLVSFAPMSLPPEKVVSAAVFRVVATSATTGPIGIARVTSPWDEGTPGTLPSYTDLISFSLTSGAGAKTWDISPIVEAWKNGAPNYGIILISDYSVGGKLTFASRENATVANRPTLTVALQDVAQIPAISTVTGSMEVTLAVPQHRPGIGNRVSVTGAGTVSISGSAPNVKYTRNMRFPVPAATLTQLFPGGESVTPDAIISVDGPMGEYYLSTPDAKQYIAVPSITSVPSMEINIEGATNNDISLQTDRKVRVIGAMTMTTALVGVYNADDDRYLKFVSGTVDSDDTWLPLDDVSGNIARDIAAPPEGFGSQADNPLAFYMGSPELNITGPYLKKAVRFDGVDDYVAIEYARNVFINDITLEFSVKTTQQNGTLFTGDGWRVNDVEYTDQTKFAPKPNFNGADATQIQLIDGKIALKSSKAYSSLTNKTSAYVADGEWHHVVISVPWSSLTGGGQWNFDRPFFIAVDGKTVWKRYGAGSVNNVSLMPSAAMAQVSYDSSGAPIVANAVAGEMSHIVVRLGYPVSEQVARKLYYEWSEALLVNATPMTVSLSAPAPTRARGNKKRMIVLYGLQYGWAEEAGLRGETSLPNGALFTYYSTFAGYYIANGRMDSFPYQPAASMWDNGSKAWAVKPFELEEFLCYPVAIHGASADYRMNPLSAPGMERDDLRDPQTGMILDDETGMPRFFDVNTDLKEPVNNFDVITAVNYPAATPDHSYERHFNVDTYYEPKQESYGLTISQWQIAREKLRDSILEAAEAGSNLWINEPWMAEHLGFIQGWDKHLPSTDPSLSPPNPMAGDLGASWDRTAWFSNKRGDALDRAHMEPGKEANAYESSLVSGRYIWTWQHNSKREIVATEPGLTDLPAYELGDVVKYRSRDVWAPHAVFMAYDVVDRRAGLQIGDELTMSMAEEEQAINPYWSSGSPRQFIVSARPQGIAGKVISKEVDFYYGRNGEVVPNPYANNVYTIVAERGTVVRGRPIGGRAFIELMGPDTRNVKIAVDKTRGMWKGSPNQNVTTWDFDTRRYSQLVAANVLTSVKLEGNSLTLVSKEQRYVEQSTPEHVFLPYLGMNARGLNWLAEASEIPTGTVRVFASAITLNVAAPAPKVTKTGSAVVSVTGTMRVDIDLRQPRNYRGADLREKALPMVINISMAGIGKLIKATPITLIITAPTGVRGTGGGDRINVYMDTGTNVTLYLKED